MKSFIDLTEKLLSEGASQALLSKLEALHKKTFPKGWFKGRVSNRLGGGSANHISFSFGIVPEREVSNNILQNDPGHHLFSISETDGKYEVKVLNGGLNVNPPAGANLVMKRVKSKWRKVTGDEKKVMTAFERWFPKFKQIVKQHKEEICGVERYSKGIFEELREDVKLHIEGEPNAKEEATFDKLMTKHQGEVTGMSSKGMYFSFKDKNTADRFKKDAKKLKSIRIG